MQDLLHLVIEKVSHSTAWQVVALFISSAAFWHIVKFVNLIVGYLKAREERQSMQLVKIMQEEKDEERYQYRRAYEETQHRLVIAEETIQELETRNDDEEIERRYQESKDSQLGIVVLLAAAALGTFLVALAPGMWKQFSDPRITSYTEFKNRIAHNVFDQADGHDKMTITRAGSIIYLKNTDELTFYWHWVKSGHICFTAKLTDNLEADNCATVFKEGDNLWFDHFPIGGNTRWKFIETDHASY